GWPAVQAILSTRVVPGFGDWLAARKAYDTQMTSEKETPGRPDNLFEPVPGAFGAHGRFDACAQMTSVQWWLSSRRWQLAAGLALALAAGTALRRRRRAR